MYDSTNLDDIPTTATMVASYIDGKFVQKSEQWARFPNAQKITIACFPGTTGADVYDVETGDLKPSDCPGVWLRERAAGREPACYVNRSNWPQVIYAFHISNIPPPKRFWVSTLDCVEILEPGSDATQWAGSNCSGGHYDLSIVADSWPEANMTQQEFDAFVAANEPLQRMMWRVKAMFDDTDLTEPNQPVESNKLKVAIAAIKPSSSSGAVSKITLTGESVVS
jgi:hypothetical protein